MPRTLHLRKNWERIKTEPGLGRNVATLVALVVLAALAGGWILGNQNFTPPWSDDLRLSAEFEALPGIAPGNGQEVRVSGVMVGNIVEAEVNERGRPEVVMTVDKDVPVYRDATLVLRPKSPLNEMYVTIDPGTREAGRANDGFRFAAKQTRRPVQVDEVLGSLDDDARGALTVLLSEADDAVATAPRGLAPGADATGLVLDDLQPVVEQLDTRRAALARLVAAISDISQAVGDNDERLVSLAGKLQTTLDAVADEGGELGQTLDQLPDVVSTLRGSTRAITALTEELDPTLRDVQDAADTLPDALERVGDTARTLDETLDRAGPVVERGKPVVADLRPFVDELDVALPELRRSTARLDPITSTLVDYLPDVGAFMVNTRSLTSLRDGNGGILRGMLTVQPTSLPTDLLAGLAPDDVEAPRG